MTSIQPYFVFSTYEYHKKLVMQGGIAHVYDYYQDCSDLGRISAIPDACVDIFFQRDENGISPQVCGTVLRRTALDYQQDREYFGIRFMPGVLPANLRVGMGELINRQVLLSDVVRSRELAERIADAPCWRDAVRLFAQDHLRCMEQTGSSGKRRLADYLRDVILSTAGNIRVRQLAEDTGYSTRYVNAVFDEFMGISLKTFEEIVRFQYAIQWINRHQEEQLTTVGQEAGYFDQAHFIREFKKHIAMTPAAYRQLVRESAYNTRLSLDDF